MAVYNTNQTRQLYVVTSAADNIAEDSSVGTITVKGFNNNKEMYFKHMGYGGITRSDKITVSNITYAKVTDADDLAHPLKRFKVTLSENVNEGELISNQEYILRIIISNYIGLSEEYKEAKYGMVFTNEGMTKSDFYKKMVKSLLDNIGKNENRFFTFYLTAGDDTTEVNQDNYSTLTGSNYDGIIIEEYPQRWILGVCQQEPVLFYPQTATIAKSNPGVQLISSDPVTLKFEPNETEYVWGTVENMTPVNKIEDGHNMADLEYFCMGERGDQYRNAGWPNVIRTQYIVNPEKKYNTIDIHYHYIGSNESVQKSEKDITLVILKDGENPDALTNDVIGKINAISGLSLATLGTSPTPGT